MPDETNFDFIDIPALAALRTSDYQTYLESMLAVDHHGVLRIAGGPPAACTREQYEVLISYLANLESRVGIDWTQP